MDGERRKQHECIRGEEIGELMEFKRQAQDMMKTISKLFIQSFVQLVIILVIAGGVIYEIFKGVK